MFLLKEHERFFLHCTLMFRPNRNKGIGLELITDGRELDALTLIERAWRAGKAKVEFGKDDNLRITKVERHPKQNLVVLLMRRGDPDAAGQVYEHKKTGQLRRSDKTDEDLVAVSCHLFIRTKRLTGAEPRYHAVLEEVPGIGRSVVQHLLTTIIEPHAYTYQNDRGEDKSTFARAVLDGIKGEKLGDDGNVSFEYVELVRQGTAEGLDMPTFVPKEQKLRLKIQTGAHDVLGKLDQLKDWALGNGWEDIRVRMNMPEGKSRIVSVTREADAADVLFVRAVPIALKKAMDPCSDHVCAELMEHAVTELKER